MVHARVNQQVAWTPLIWDESRSPGSGTPPLVMPQRFAASVMWLLIAPRVANCTMTINKGERPLLIVNSYLKLPFK